jgi:tetratricopeptide (TPR) repeat protein
VSELEHGRALLAARRPADALAHLQRAIAADPTDAEAHCSLAVALLRLDRPADAIQAAERAAACDPDLEWPHRVRALALLRLRKPKPALAAAEQAVRLAPDQPHGHFVVVDCHLARQHVTEAARAAERCRAVAPDQSMGHHAMARVALASRRWREAEAACRQALAIDPDDATVRHDLGVAISKQRGRTVEGIEHLTAASRLDPTDGSSRTQAVKTARAWVGGGAIGLYFALRTVLFVGRNWNSQRGTSIAMISIVVAVVVGLLVLRRHRLARLPAGVRELVPRRRRR